MDIKDFQNSINEGHIKWSTHCLERLHERDISRKEVKECILKGEIIEEYPEDKPHPSALILNSKGDRPLHVVSGLSDKSVFIVTAYEPDNDHFESDYKTRKE